jgi:hypothetical protein
MSSFGIGVFLLLAAVCWGIGWIIASTRGWK